MNYRHVWILGNTVRLSQRVLLHFAHKMWEATKPLEFRSKSLEVKNLRFNSFHSCK